MASRFEIEQRYNPGGSIAGQPMGAWVPLEYRWRLLDEDDRPRAVAPAWSLDREATEADAREFGDWVKAETP